MATPAQNLEVAIGQLVERIVSVTASDQPDYSENGRSVSKGAYLAQLQQSLDGLTLLRSRLGGPYLIQSRGRAV